MAWTEGKASMSAGLCLCGNHYNTQARHSAIGILQMQVQSAPCMSKCIAVLTLQRHLHACNATTRYLNHMGWISKNRTRHGQKARLPIWHVIATIQLLYLPSLVNRRCSQNGPICTCNKAGRRLLSLILLCHLSYSVCFTKL